MKQRNSVRAIRTFVFLGALTILFTFAASAQAGGGSWGSSLGGFGSGGGGGSWGSRGGLLGGRQPVRNLLSRVGGGIADIVDRAPIRSALFGGGSNGGSNGGSGGLLSGLGSRRGFGSGGGFGSRGGLGSRGGMAGGWGSSGTGMGSTGSYSFAPSGSTGSSVYSGNAYSGFGSTGSATQYISTAPAAPVWSGADSLYAGSATAMDYGDWGSAYLDGFGGGGVVASSLQSSMDLSVSDMSYPIDQYDETSAPMLDYGYTGGSVGDIGMPTDAVMLDGGDLMTGGMMSGFGNGGVVNEGMPIESPTDFQSDFPSGGSVIEDGIQSDPFYPETGTGEADGQPQPPAPVEDTRIDRKQRNTSPAILSLQLPADAKVYINDRLTKTDGEVRKYVSRNLKDGKDYRYRVKAVIEKDGQTIVRSQVVTMRTGLKKAVKLNFEPVLTTLVLNVPEDAKVVLDGQETAMTGSQRTFSTKKLNEGSWEDYTVEVIVEKDGQQVVQQKSLDLSAGETRFLDFKFEGNVSGIAAK